jgi:FG-GAP-like repeat/Abnormal spindle-like microcephaly-assoc'd, ASPM-SPD-2-Hydin
MLRMYPPFSSFGRSLVSSALVGYLLLWTAGSATAQNTAVFNGPRDYVAGLSPNSVVVADFNGDGLPDFAVANGGLDVGPSTTVSVFLQNSDGTFQPAVNYSVGNGPEAIQTGDVNGDGKADLLVLNSTDNTLSVLLGNGDGTFQTQKVTTLPTGTIPGSAPLALGNFNSDNYLDVAMMVSLSQVGTYGINVLLGNGDGTFQAPVTYALNARPSVLAVADFNNDGKPDIAAGTSAGVSVMLGNGNGTFQSAANTSMTNSPTAGLVIADFNQDGNLDIATSVFPPMAQTYLDLLYGNGDGTFQVQPPLNTGALEGLTPLAAGDLNGDGKPDLIASGPIQSLLNNGDGTFSVADVLWGIGGGAVALSDLQSNQKLDLIAEHGAISIVWGNGDGTFSVFPAYSEGLGGGQLAAADLNGDNKIDLAENGPGVLLNTGAGFSAVSLIPVAPAATAWVGTGLFDGNSDTDLIVAGVVGGVNGSEVGFLLGNGNGTFQPGTYWGSNVSGPIATGDFNNDGNLDVLGVSGTGFSANEFAVLLGAGNGTFGFPVETAVSGPIAALGTAKFKTGGNVDVAAIVGEAAQVFVGNGDGTFSVGPILTSNNPPATAIAVDDLNGDGNPDLVVAAYSNGAIQGSVYVFLGNGDGTFQSPVTTAGGCQVGSIGVGDFNGDGKPDVALSNGCWGDVSILLGNGNGTLQAPVQFAAGGGSLVVADFDGNGSPDLAVSGSGGFVNLLLSGGAHGSAALVSPGILTFPGGTVGEASAQQNVGLTNTNASALTISGIAISGAQAGDYAETNNCGTSLASGRSCAIAVTFTAQAAGTRNANLQITDSAFNSPQTVSLTGIGSGVSVSPTSLTFVNEPVGSTSLQPVVLANGNSSALSISGITFYGPQSGYFFQTNNCGSSLAAGTSCTISVQFTPQAPGTADATMQINDNASNSPQTVSLTGIGNGFVWGSGSGQSGSATVSAGQSTTFNLTLTRTGSFSGTVNLSCAITPAAKSAPTCSVPSSVSLSGSSAAAVTATVSTTAPSTSGSVPLFEVRPPTTTVGGLLALGVFGLLLFGSLRRARIFAIPTVLAVLVFVWGCGGSSPTTTTTTNSGTPAGTYTATITSTSGSLTNHATVTVIVQ